MLISFESARNVDIFLVRYQWLSMQCFDYPMIHGSLELLVESSVLLNIFSVERCSAVLAGKDPVLLHLQKAVDVELNNTCNFVVARNRMIFTNIILDFWCSKFTVIYSVMFRVLCQVSNTYQLNHEFWCHLYALKLSQIFRKTTTKTTGKRDSRQPKMESQLQSSSHQSRYQSYKIPRSTSFLWNPILLKKLQKNPCVRKPAPKVSALHRQEVVGVDAGGEAMLETFLFTK